MDVVLKVLFDFAIEVWFSIKTICHIVTGILILIGRLRCFKEAMGMFLDKCIFQNKFP